MALYIQGFGDLIASRDITTLHAGLHPLPFSVLNQQEILHAPQKKQTVGEQQNINSTWPGSPGETISFRLVNCEFTERPPSFAEMNGVHSFNESTTK